MPAARPPHRRIIAAGVVIAIAIATATAPPAHAEPDQPPRRIGQVITVAGTGEEGYSGDGWAARDALLGGLITVEVGPDSTVYIADTRYERLRRVGIDGVIDTVPGAREAVPHASAVAPDGTLYITTGEDIRRFDRTGTATVIGGGGTLSHFDGGTGGDGGPATEAHMNDLDDIAVDSAGNVYIAHADRIRRIDPSGTISTVAGGGARASESADGKPATDADLPRLRSVAVDRAGTVYFPGPGGHTLYGVGTDGTLAHVAELSPSGKVGGIAVDAEGTVHVLDETTGQVHRVGEDGTLTAAGPPVNGRALDVAVGPDGDLYVAVAAKVLRIVLSEDETPADAAPEPVRSRWADDEPGAVHTVAGTGHPPTAADSAPPSDQSVPGPRGVAVGPDGTVYFVDRSADQVRTIAPDGSVGVVEQVPLDNPTAVAADAAGNVYIADTGGDKILRVDPGGSVHTLASVPDPRELAGDSSGAVYVTSYDDWVVRKIDANGQVTTVAGGGAGEERADNVPALQVTLSEPDTVAAGGDGTVYFVEDQAVRAVRPDGILVTVAGSIEAFTVGHFAGDGGPATQAELNEPRGLAVGPDGSLYVADSHNNRIRRIDPNSTITTIAGTGERADKGDGGPAAKAALTQPSGVAVGQDGAVYVSGEATGRVRRIAPDGTISTLAELTPGKQTEKRTATETALFPASSPSALAVGVDGTVYLASYPGGLHAVAQDGTMSPVDSPQDIPSRGHIPTRSQVATGRDGSLYLAIKYPAGDWIQRRYPDGAVVSVAGGGSNEQAPEPGQLATSGYIDVRDMATGPDGELYLGTADAVYVLTADGTLEEVLASDGDLVEELGGIAVGPDGTVYAITGSRVLAVTDGKAEPVAGTGEPSSTTEEDEGGGPALEASLGVTTDIAVTADGSLFVATSDGIRRVDADGDIETVVPLGSDSPASALAVGPGGDLYFAEPRAHRVRVVVRPAEIAAPFRFPWTALWLTALALVLAAGALIAVRRHRMRTARATPTAI